MMARSENLNLNSKSYINKEKVIYKLFKIKFKIINEIECQNFAFYFIYSLDDDLDDDDQNK